MRNTILDMLKAAEGYISGEEISQTLGISRAAVWKHIKKLRSEGYDIQSVTNKGYKISEDTDMLSPDCIESHITTDFIARNIKFTKVCDSTNEEAKRFSGLPDGTLFISETQTGGKGRLGRSWNSQRGTGIWMSLLLKPEVPPQEIPQITLIAGIAVCRAVGNGARIKWPNDIVIGSRKICGILTEMSAEMERVNYVICGMGINVNTPAFPDDLADKATSLLIETGLPQKREPIAARVMNEFEPLYKQFLEKGFAAVLKEYKADCVTLNREVRVIYRNSTIIGTAVDVTADGGLVVDTADGKITITSGDVSVRGMYGYI